MATASRVPVVGDVFPAGCDESNPMIQCSKVIKVDPLGEGMYRITAQNASGTFSVEQDYSYLSTVPSWQLDVMTDVDRYDANLAEWRQKAGMAGVLAPRPLSAYPEKEPRADYFAARWQNEQDAAHNRDGYSYGEAGASDFFKAVAAGWVDFTSDGLRVFLQNQSAGTLDVVRRGNVGWDQFVNWSNGLSFSPIPTSTAVNTQPVTQPSQPMVIPPAPVPIPTGGGCNDCGGSGATKPPTGLELAGPAPTAVPYRPTSPPEVLRGVASPLPTSVSTMEGGPSATVELNWGLAILLLLIFYVYMKS